MAGREREMALLGDLARRASAFLQAAAASYYFFSYAMGVTGTVYVALAVAPLLGVSHWVAGFTGALLGVAAATLLSQAVAGPVWRYLASRGFTGGPRPAVVMGVAAAGMALGFAAAMIAAGAGAGWLAAVAWYPSLALGLSLAGLWLAVKGYSRGLLQAGLGLAATSPLPLALAWRGLEWEANMAASGLVLLVLLAAGSAGLRDAARRLEEG